MKHQAKLKHVPRHFSMPDAIRRHSINGTIQAVQQFNTTPPEVPAHIAMQ